MTHQAFMRRHRFTIARRITELLVLILLRGPPAGDGKSPGSPCSLGTCRNRSFSE